MLVVLLLLLSGRESDHVRRSAYAPLPCTCTRRCARAGSTRLAIEQRVAVAVGDATRRHGGRRRRRRRAESRLQASVAPARKTVPLTVQSIATQSRTVEGAQQALVRVSARRFTRPLEHVTSSRSYTVDAQRRAARGSFSRSHDPDASFSSSLPSALPIPLRTLCSPFNRSAPVGLLCEPKRRNRVDALRDHDSVVRRFLFPSSACGQVSRFDVASRIQSWRPPQFRLAQPRERSMLY